MNKLLILGAVTLFLPACAPQWEWRHPTSDPAQFLRDSYECRKDAQQAGAQGTVALGSWVAGAMAQAETFAHCMMARGCYKAPRSQ